MSAKPPDTSIPTAWPSYSVSVTWKIHQEVVLLLGWGRAILLQFAHPLVVRGVADHSGFLTERRGRWRRLYRTLGAMLTLTFGSPEEALAVARRINRIHDRVQGQLPDAAGGVPANCFYSAHDAALLTWVHATLLDSFLLTYELYVGPLTPREKDQYCLEATAIEPLLGIPQGTVPRSAAELREYMAGKLSSGEIVVTEIARRLAREVVFPPHPLVARPAIWLAQLPTIGLLPRSIREAYGFPWDSRRQMALQLSARLMRGLLPLTPSIVRHWPAARAAFRREHSRAPAA